MTPTPLPAELAEELRAKAEEEGSKPPAVDLAPLAGAEWLTDAGARRLGDGLYVADFISTFDRELGLTKIGAYINTARQVCISPRGYALEIEDHMGAELWITLLYSSACCCLAAGWQDTLIWRCTSVLWRLSPRAKGTQWTLIRWMQRSTGW
jgi:hypothetical protein